MPSQGHAASASASAHYARHQQNRSSYKQPTKASDATPGGPPAQSLLVGLRIANSAGFTHVAAESDALALITALHDKTKYLSPISAILDDIVTIQQSFISVTYSYIPRGCNSVAHNLACMARSSRLDFHLHSDVPSGIHKFVILDLQGLAF